MPGEGTDEPSEQHEQHIERRIVTVLFADLVGFTTMSEQLDPEDVAAVQDAYFTAVRETIGRYRGTLEKFIGDAAMAVFGVPRTRDDDAERAVRAGLALASSVDQLSGKVGLPEGALRLRVGVNTGEVLHAEGEPGEWRVTGDAVNVAARFQAAAPPGGVLLGETTALAVEQAVELEPVGAIELKGKSEPVRAWLAGSLRPSPSREHAMGGLRAPILGRHGELAMLAEAVGRVAGGGSERVVVMAPPGVGKSRLFEEAAARAGRGGAGVWRARLRPDLLAPFDPVAQLFTAAVSARTGGPSADRADLAGTLADLLTGSGATAARAEVVIEEVLAVVAPAARVDAGPATVEAGDREKRFLAWLEALDALAGEGPVVWVVEDVHWAGGDLLAFLRQAGAEASRPGRLVLASSRPSLLEREPAWCSDDPGARTQVVHLPALTPLHAEDLIRALVGDALPPELVATVAERSDGNPLFIEELLRTWISVGALTRGEGGAFHLAARADEVPLPATVQAIYAAQLDDLPANARSAARTASVAGRRFPLASLDPMGVTDAEAAIGVLHRQALVAGPLVDPLLGSSFAFRHALLRDAGYASLARAERARLHVRLGRWLEQAAGDRLDEVAEVIGNHYRAALSSVPQLAHEVGEGLGRDQAARMAAGWFERAAEAALHVSAHDSARALLRQALDLTPEADALDRARRWRRLGDATAYVEDLDEGAAAYQHAADLSGLVLEDRTAVDEDRRTARTAHAMAILLLGLTRIQQLRFKDAVALAEEALARIGAGNDPDTGWLLYLRAWGSIAFAYQPEARADLERAMQLALAAGDRRLELEVRGVLVTALAEDGTLTRDQIAAEDERTAELAIELGEWQRASRALWGRAAIQLDDHASESIGLLGRAVEIAEAHAFTEGLAWLDYLRTEMGLVMGDWDAAVQAGTHALDVADKGAFHRVQVRTWFALSPIAFARGDRPLLERAHRWFEGHQDIFPHSPFGNVMHGGVDARLAASGFGPFEPDPEEIFPAWDESQGMPSWYAAVEAILDAWLASGRTDVARRALDRIASWREHPTTTSLARGSQDLMRCRLIVAEGGASSGAEAAGWSALEAFRRSNAPWWIGKAIRALEAGGGADAALVDEAEAIERDLKLMGTAR